MIAMIIFICYTLPKIIISVFQIRHIRQKMQQKAFILPSNEYQEAGLYAIIKEKVHIVEYIVHFIILIIILTYGLQFFEHHYAESLQNIFTAALYILLVLIAFSLYKVPFDIYKTFYIEKKFGFFKGNVWLFISDSLKSLCISCIFGFILIAAILYIFENIPYWWLAASGLLFATILLINLIYPTLIAPFFNKFTPLEDMALKEHINTLMQKVGFSSNGIYIIDASKRDGKLNAYFGGLGKSKRVVLFDTLLEKVTTKQLIAILGHELGHFKNHDIYKNIIFSAMLICVIFFLMSHIPVQVFHELNITQTSYNYLLIIMLVADLISLWLMPLMGLLSRHNEYKADSFGAAIESKEALREALLVLVNENKSFPSSHPLYIFFYYTHPPLLERLKALGYQEP